MAIHNYLDLSTNYMRETDPAILDAIYSCPSDAPLRVIKHEYGYWVNVQLGDEGYSDRVCDMQAYGLSVDFIAVYGYARDNKCCWINFDRDADTDIDELPLHEW